MTELETAELMSLPDIRALAMRERNGDEPTIIRAAQAERVYRSRLSDLEGRLAGGHVDEVSRGLGDFEPLVRLMEFGPAPRLYKDAVAVRENCIDPKILGGAITQLREYLEGLAASLQNRLSRKDWL